MQTANVWYSSVFTLQCALQTQCSSLVRDGKLLVKLKRLMPTVGCEADSVAYNEEARTTELQAASGSAAPLILQSGSYSIPADFNESSRYGNVQTPHNS